jgi:hypothetical protein
MLKIPALILYFQMQAASTFLISPSLGFGKGLFSFPIPTWIVNNVSVGTDGKRRETDINTDFLFGRREDSRGNLVTRKDCVPFGIFSLDSKSFDCALNGSMQLNANKSNILDAKFLVELNPITVGREGNTVEPVLSLETREPSSTDLDSAEERIERPLQSSENILTGGVIQNGDLRKSVSEFFELSSLVVIIQREFSASPRITPLFKSKIIECTSSIKKQLQLLGLDTRRKQTVFEGTPQLFAPLLLNVPFDSFLADRTNCSSIVGTRPERGQTRFKSRKFISQFVGSKSFQSVSDFGDRPTGIAFQEKVNVVRHDFKGVNDHLKFFAFCLQENFEAFGNATRQNRSPIFWTPDEMIFEAKNSPGIFSIPVFHLLQYTTVSNQNQEEKTQFLCRLKSGSPLA